MHRVALDEQERVSLLLATPTTRGDNGAPPVRMPNFHARLGQRCRLVRLDGSEETEDFAVLTCESGERLVREYFLRVSETAVRALGAAPTARQVVDAVRALAELFRAAESPQRKSVQGLWAELLLMSISRDAPLLAEAWHSEPRERFDFAWGGARLEVKSAAGDRREHHFSLEQVRPVTAQEVGVASFLVERTGAGDTLEDLLLQLSGRLASRPDLMLRVEDVVARTLGGALLRSLREGFDVRAALRSLRLYRAMDIPAVDTPLPPALSDVRFRVDMSTVPESGASTIGLEPLWAALPVT